MRNKKVVILFCFMLVTIPLFSVQGTMNYNMNTKFDRSNIMAGWIEKQQLLASDGDLLDNFGYCVDIDGDYAIVSSFADNVYAGSAYIFKYDGSNWDEQQKLTASDAESNDHFSRVSICGEYAVIGAYGDSLYSGSAYVFKRSGSTWTEQQKLTASDPAGNDYFGISTSIDGEYVVIGAYYKNSQQGAAYVFKRDGSTWSQQQKLTASGGAAGDHFGICVSIDGDYILIGSQGNSNSKGAAYVFKRTGTVWNQEAKLTASDGADDDRFGISVSLDEDYAIIGAFYDDSEKGSAYVFKRSGTSWAQEDKLTASDGIAGDRFGVSVSIDGEYGVVSAYYDENEKGSVYVFKRSGTSWTQEQKLIASNGAGYDWFGIDIVIDGSNILIGAYGDDNANGNNAGSAYIFERENNAPYPPTIDGPTSGKVGEFYDYDFTNCVDPDGDDMTYHVEWDDGGVDDGFVASGGAFTLSHSWNSEGTFTIRAKLIDVYGAESNWATYDVVITKKSRAMNTPFFNWLQNHLNMFLLLQTLLQRFGLQN